MLCALEAENQLAVTAIVVFLCLVLAEDRMITIPIPVVC